MIKYKLDELKPILIRPLDPIVFRWGGEYSPILTGPMNKGSSEPLPLPSTIAGFLYWILTDGNTTQNNNTQDEPNIQKDYETISSKVEIFGPFFYAKSKDGKENGKTCLAIHQFPKKLRVINEECKLVDYKSGEQENIFEPVYISKIGIGHEISKKRAHTESGLIYTVEYIDYYATAVKKFGIKEVEEYGILVYTNAPINEGYYPFGSEGRLVEVKNVQVDITKVKIFGPSIYVLSPIILKANESPSPLVISSDINKLVVDMEGEKEIKAGDFALNFMRISLIGLGFNVRYNVKRPIYLAMMPWGVEIKDEEEKTKFDSLLNNLIGQNSSGIWFLKLGLFDKIWGSVLIKGDSNEQRQ